MSSDDNTSPFTTSEYSPSSPSIRAVKLMSSYQHSSPAPKRAKRMPLTEETTAELITDEVAIIFSFLSLEDIMRARVCKTWRDAAKKTIVPPSDFAVSSTRYYNAMRVISTALPNLQKLSIYGLDNGHKYSDGDDPNRKRAARTANYRTHDINIISNFSKLRILHIFDVPLNGRYPALFQFPLVEQLIISNCKYLKWDLEMLSGFPLLKVLDCTNHTDDYSYPKGNISSLRVLKDTIEKVIMCNCRSVHGNFMDMAAFPHLRELDLVGTSVTGDIRDIHNDDFPIMEELFLPTSVVGGVDYKFRRISDVHIFMEGIRSLMKRSPTLFKTCDILDWGLSEDSPEWYDRVRDDLPPPFDLGFVQAGSRLGWSWCSNKIAERRHYCEVNWLDPEPSTDSSDYEAYVEELQRISQRIDFVYARGNTGVDLCEINLLDPEPSSYSSYHETPYIEELIAFGLNRTLLLELG